MRRLPSSVNGSVTTATVSTCAPPPRRFAIDATTGAAPGAGAAAEAARDEDHLGTLDGLADLLGVVGGRTPPDVGFAPAPRPFVSASPIWILFRAPFLQSACTSVLMVTNFTPCSPASIMRLTAFPPPPPTPTTVMRAGLEASSANVAIRLPNIVFLLLARRCSSTLRLAGPCGRDRCARGVPGDDVGSTRRAAARS
jgi:hypothetical protein